MWLGYGSLENRGCVSGSISRGVSAPSGTREVLVRNGTSWASWEIKGSTKQVPVSLLPLTGRMQWCEQETGCPQGCVTDRWGSTASRQQDPGDGEDASEWGDEACGSLEEVERGREGAQGRRQGASPSLEVGPGAQD